MPYLYNTPEDQREMLDAIGAKSINELFAGIPDELKLDRDLDVPPALSEMEMDQHLRKLAAKNSHAGNAVCFLGGGSYDHFVPAVVDTIGSRSEFYTSYTPYQAEASQGNLQVVFEYQSLITRPHRHGCLERQPVRRRQCRGRSCVDGSELCAQTQ